MFKAITSVGNSFLKDFNKPFNLIRKLSCFSTSVNYSNTQLIQNACSQRLAFAQNSLTRTLLQANSNNLCLSRNVTKFSLKTGKKRSVRTVLTRFYRLHNGLWIRTVGGCHKKLHKKNCFEKYRLKQHIVCTRTQCIKFDKMTTDYVKKRKYYIDDPYEPYQDRNNFDWFLPREKWDRRC